MMMRFAMATAAVLLGCGSAYAQARLNVSPLPALGMTSPLGIPNAPVGHTGIPLGATELATPGVSPTTSGPAPLIGAPCFSSFQYRKRNPAVVATLLFWKKAFANPPLNCERMRPM